jgi:transposase
VSVSRSTMLRALMALPIPPEPVPRVLSVDDVALRRGRRYMLNAVGASDLPAVHAFVRGLRKDLSAVVAGLTLPYSNGPIEGTNTKVKLLRREMYGRAGFALLRKRVLLS